MMRKQVMVCGVDCHPGDRNCNGYCTGDAKHPPEATEEQKIETAKQTAYRAREAAEKAWFEYAGPCEVGLVREHAFLVYDRIRRSGRI